jgi:hypothetical protein
VQAVGGGPVQAQVMLTVAVSGLTALVVTARLYWAAGG